LDGRDLHSITNLSAVLAVAQDYARHNEIYKPEVASTLVRSHTGNDFSVYMRIVKSKFFLTDVLNVEHDIHFVPLDAKRVYSRTYSTRIAEVSDAGTPERARAAGRQRSRPDVATLRLLVLRRTRRRRNRGMRVRHANPRRSPSAWDTCCPPSCIPCRPNPAQRFGIDAEGGVERPVTALRVELKWIPMDRVPSSIQDSNLLRVYPFSLDRLLSHIDPARRGD